MMNSHYTAILRRYVGRQVCLSMYGQIKLWGEVAEIYDDSLRLVNTVFVGELEDQGWYSQLQHADPDNHYGPRSAETVVHFHHIVSITCPDEDLPAPSLPGEADADTGGEAPAQQSTDEAETHLQVDRLTVEIGLGLVKLADPDRGGELLAQISRLRDTIAGSLGFLMPRVRVHDCLRLEQPAYRILIDDCEVARGELRPDGCLAIDSGATTGRLEGETATEPAFGMPARWIDPQDRRRAEQLGYTVVEPAAVLATHLGDVVQRHAAELFSFEAMSHLLVRTRRSAPTVVDELVPNRLPVGVLHHVLCRLMVEGVPIKNLVRILEALARYAPVTTDAEALVAVARLALRRTICDPFRDDRDRLHLIALDGPLEDRLGQLIDARQGTVGREWVERLVDRLGHARCQAQAEGREIALVVDVRLRHRLWQMIAPHLPQLSVLAYAEVPRELHMELETTVTLEEVGAPDPEPRPEPSSHVTGTREARDGSREGTAAKSPQPAAPKKSSRPPR